MFFVIVRCGLVAGRGNGTELKRGNIRPVLHIGTLRRGVKAECMPSGFVGGFRLPDSAQKSTMLAGSAPEGEGRDDV